METLKLPATSTPDSLPSIIQHPESSKNKKTSIYNALSKSSLKKRPALQQDFHYGLLKY